MNDLNVINEGLKMKDRMTEPMNGLSECMKERKRDIHISLYRNRMNLYKKEWLTERRNEQMWRKDVRIKPLIERWIVRSERM